MMKKILIALVVFLLIGIIGAMANTDDIQDGNEANLSTSDVNITLSDENITPLQDPSDTDLSGDDEIEIEKFLLCAWSQDHTDDLEDGDPGHQTAGSQFLPTCDYEITKTVSIWAVIENMSYDGDMDEVFARLSHPDEPDLDITMNQVDPEDFSSEVFKEALDAGILQFEDELKGEAVLSALDNSSAKLWFGEDELQTSQSAGLYNVSIMPFMEDNHEIAGMPVNFTYVPVVCGEFDFCEINYGDLTVNEVSWVTGDDDFSTENLPTVRNLGNVPLQLVIEQDSMGIVSGEDENWNLEYGARLGSEGETCIYYPDEPVTVPGILERCSEKALSMSILVSGVDPGTELAGELNIECVAAE